MTIFVGTSGWQYRHWRERFYPVGVAQKDWLEFYAERFATVESNNAFYRLPDPKTFANWAQRTPDDFVFTVKVSRYLTHIRRLREPTEPVARFVDHARHLGDKLGPVLLQLPPTLKCSTDDLDATLARFAAEDSHVRVAVEFRHDSWFIDAVRHILETYGAALCLADGSLTVKAGRKIHGVMSPEWRTTDWGYLRFHHGAASPDPCYGRRALATWVDRLKKLFGSRVDVFVYFNNDGAACALRDARVFAGLLEASGVGASRVVGPREVTVG
jgi:uncharacterized protein YecE (DUF72 family)